MENQFPINMAVRYSESRMKTLPAVGLLFVAIISLAGCSGVSQIAVYEPEEGDLVFQALKRDQDLVVAIEGVTKSDYSHVGVLLKRSRQWEVIEARGSGVLYTPFAEWKKIGRKGRWAAYRVKKAHRRHLPQFLAALHPHVGKPYDFKYELSEKKRYCSELVYHAWKEATGQPLGRLARLGDLNWEPHQATIEKYNNGPVVLERKIISPMALSRAEQLKRVYNHGLDP